MLAESGGILTFKKPGFPSCLKIWLVFSPDSLISISSTSLLSVFFLDEFCLSHTFLASYTLFLPSWEKAFIPSWEKAFSQLLVLTWQMFSTLVLVYILISANKVLHLVLVTPNSPLARFCQSCVPCSTSPSSSC